MNFPKGRRQPGSITPPKTVPLEQQVSTSRKIKELKNWAKKSGGGVVLALSCTWFPGGF